MTNATKATNPNITKISAGSAMTTESMIKVIPQKQKIIMMIKRIVKIFYLIGIIFWCGMLLSSVFKLIGYNEIFDLFIIKNAQITNFEILEDIVDVNNLSIHYSYNVGETVFNKKLEVAQSYFKENFRFSNDSTIEVSYNSNFPHLSYITTLPLEIRKQKTGVVISLNFICFLSVIYFFGVRKLFSP